MSETTASSAVESRRGSAGEVFLVALRLGLTSFGGPIAHLGYFERTYVRERQWLTGRTRGPVPDGAGPREQPGRLFGRVAPRRLGRGICSVGRLHLAFGARDVGLRALGAAP